MKKVLLVLFSAISMGLGLAWGQYAASVSDPEAVPAVIAADEDVNHEDMDNQQINEDEGYGADDEEYNSSENAQTTEPAPKQ